MKQMAKKAGDHIFGYIVVGLFGLAVGSAYNGLKDTVLSWLFPEVAPGIIPKGEWEYTRRLEKTESRTECPYGGYVFYHTDSPFVYESVTECVFPWEGKGE